MQFASKMTVVRDPVRKFGVFIYLFSSILDRVESQDHGEFGCH